MGMRCLTRKVLRIGNSYGVTLPSDWVKFMEWLRKRKLREVLCLVNNVVVIVPPDMEEEGRRLLSLLEGEDERPPEG